MVFEAVIGLEVHSHLKTSSKLFCGCPTEFGALPNSNICPVCTGNPGVLPVLNKKAVELLVRSALALNCKINRRSVFARKHYFYPDLPKNFQISQYELPIAYDGFINIRLEDGSVKKIRIKRIHLEEDAGKLLHAIGSKELDHSLVDYNRTGLPLMEIVTEPDITTPQEAWLYLNSLKAVLEYIDVSDCNMEEGKFRCDANISVRPIGQRELGTKAELKNMNTTKGVRDALEFEIKRQTDLLASGGKVVQETRLYDAVSGVTEPMRSKEEAHDYRYFPEPDLPPLELSDDFINEIKGTLVELPDQRRVRFIKEYGLTEYDSDVLTSDRDLAEYYEDCLKVSVDALRFSKPAANWIITELLGKLNKEKKDIKLSPINPQRLAELLKCIADEIISGKIAKSVFEEMYTSQKSPAEIIKEKNLVQITDEGEIKIICEEVIADNPNAVSEFKAGKERALGHLVGAVMKKTGGKANPKIVNEMLKKLLS